MNNENGAPSPAEPGRDYSLEPFFELSPDLLCIAGYDGYFKKVNPAFKKLLGYPDEVLYNTPINHFVYEEDKEATHQKREALRQNKPLQNFENRYVCRSGELVWLSWTSIPVVGNKLIYAIAKNITHTKKMEAERNQLLSKYTQANEGLKLLNYATSHDLRTPVANLQTVIDLLDFSKIDDPETLEILELMKASTQNLSQALDKYVENLEQRESSGIEMEELNLSEVFNQVYRSIESLIKSSGAELQVDFSAYQKLYFNPGYLESVFLNLISNSIKYARPDQSPLIKIYSQINNGEKQLVFADNGIGFDMDKVKGRIFGLHQKFSNHQDSKGIGLYLVYNHIASLGGHIEVDSQPNQGSTFTITFRD